MSDLIATIGVEANFQPLTNMKLELDATGIAYSKMIATIERDQKRLDNAMNASASVQIEAAKRVAREQGLAALKTIQNNKRVMDSFARQYQQTQRSAAGFSHFGQAVQQTGYQVGDFFVQIQSGTNAFVAAGQQLTQLAGLIYLVNARWAIMAGTIASIAIPLATMFGAYITRTAEADAAARSFANSLQAVRDQIYDLENESSALSLGLNSSDEANLYRELLALRDQLNAKAEEYNNTTTLGGSQRRQMLMDEYQGMLKVYNQKVADLVTMRDRVKSLQEEVQHQKDVKEFAERTLSAMSGLSSAISSANVNAGTFASTMETVAGWAMTAAKAWGAVPGFIPPGAGDRYDASGSADAAARNNSMTMGKGGGRLAGGAGGVRNFPTVGGGGGGGGGGSNPIESELESLRSFLQSEAEVEIEAFQQRQDTLRAALEQRMITLEEFNSLEKELKIKHNEELVSIDALRYGNMLDQAQFVFGELASAAQAGGDKFNKIYKTFAIAEAVVTGYKAAVSAWEKGMTIGGPPVAAAYTALSLAKTGALIAGMKSGGSGGGGSSRGSVGRVQSTAALSPQTVYVSGLAPDALFTGEMLSNLFENFYQENDNRGKVFVVAR
jgi:hypothetical protein